MEQEEQEEEQEEEHKEHLHVADEGHGPGAGELEAHEVLVHRAVQAHAQLLHQG